VLIRNLELSWIPGLHSQNGKLYQPNRGNFGAFLVPLMFKMLFFSFHFLSWDFLVTQVARQGIVSPTSCNVLRNKNQQLLPAKLQLLTYRLCHLYYNWSGGVAVPAVVLEPHSELWDLLYSVLSLNSPLSGVPSYMLKNKDHCFSFEKFLINFILLRESETL